MSMTEVRVRRGGPAAVRGEMLLVPVAEGQLSAALRRLDGRVRGPLARRARAARFRGKAEETLVHHGEVAVALLGLGPVPVGLDAWRRAGARGRQEAERERARRAGVYLGDAAADVAAAFVEGFQLAGYRFAGYLSDPERRPRGQVLTLAGEAKQLGAPLAGVAALAQEIFRARDPVNEPASVATPRFLAERVAALAREIRGLEAEAWAPKRIAREGLTGLLAVARGRRGEPRFIRPRWGGPGARRRAVLVGKGITLDPRGLSLKPPQSMETMKYDMAGGGPGGGRRGAAPPPAPPAPARRRLR